MNEIYKWYGIKNKDDIGICDVFLYAFLTIVSIVLLIMIGYTIYQILILIIS